MTPLHPILGQNKQYQKLYSDTKLGNRGMWIGLSKKESGFGWILVNFPLLYPDTLMSLIHWSF